MTSPTAPVTRFTPTETEFGPPITRRYGRTHSHVTLGPLTPAGSEDTTPVGYLAAAPHPFADHTAEMAWVRWTLDALEVLAPGTFLATPLSAEALRSSDLGASLGDRRRQLMPILEPARVGRRRSELLAALESARDLGIRCAAGGNRVHSAAGFDALVVTPRNAAHSVSMGDCRLLIATDLRTEREVEWARTCGATLVEGEVIADPLRVAPVDVSRLRQ